MKSMFGVVVRASVATIFTGIFVIVMGIAVGDVLFRMHRISDEAAAWYGLNFFLPALVAAAIVFFYRFRALRKQLNMGQ